MVLEGAVVVMSFPWIILSETENVTEFLVWKNYDSNITPLPLVCALSLKIMSQLLFDTHVQFVCNILGFFLLVRYLLPCFDQTHSLFSKFTLVLFSSFIRHVMRFSLRWCCTYPALLLSGYSSSSFCIPPPVCPQSLAWTLTQSLNLALNLDKEKGL